MKFKYISYSQMVQDAVLTAQFVQTLPAFLSKNLDVTADDIIVVTITSASGSTSSSSGSSSSNKKRALLRKREDGSGVVVSIAIPGDQVSELQTLISQSNSSLYSNSNGQLATLIDSSYPITGNGKLLSLIFFLLVDIY